MCKNILKQIALSTILVASTITVKAGFFDSSYNSSLFNEEYSDFKRNTLITGRILYQDQASDKFSEGFRAEKSEVIDGMFARQVYDYGSDFSALSLFKQAKENLLSEGFEISFECEGQSCGPIEGWELLFSKDVAGIADSQFYVVGRIGNSQNPIAAKVVYVTEFDTQPRLIIDTIQRVKPPENGHIDVGDFNNMYDLWRETNSLKPVGSVFYSTSSKQLDNLSQIDTVVDAINLNPKAKFLLIGFSDPRGNDTSNKTLSLERARSLKNTLVSKYSVISDNLIVYGAGELNEPNTNFANARRVSVFKFEE